MNIYGGGAQTNKNGLQFEQDTDLNTALSTFGFIINKSGEVFNGSIMVGKTFQKHKLYTNFLTPLGVNWKTLISKKLLPDEAFFNEEKQTLFIIEKKFQNTAGSVDEKLQTCPFKLRQYKKLCASLNIQVVYTYILNDWFSQDCYKDVLEFIKEENCYYFFNELPIDFII